MKATLITVSLDQNWVLKHMVSGNSTVVAEILTALDNVHVSGSLFVLSKGFDSFSVISCRENTFCEEDVRKIITEVSEDLPVSISLEELTNEALSEKLRCLRNELTPNQRELLAEEFSIELIAPPAESVAPTAAPATKTLEDLIGLSPLKNWVRETEAIANTAAEIVRRSGLFVNTAYLFSINRGCGLTTVLDIMAQTLTRLNLVSFSGKRPVIEWNLDYCDDPKEFVDLARLAQTLQNCAGNGEFAGIVAINIEAWLDHLFEKNFQSFLRFIAGNKGRFLFVFTLPYAEDSVINKAAAQISDLMSLRVMKFIPPSDKELFHYFKACFAGFDITVEDDALPAFSRVLALEKSDGKFYGFNTVLKLINDLLYQMISSAALAHEDLKTTLSNDDLLRYTALEGDSDLSGLAQLDGMVALNEVKQKVQEILSSAKLQKELFQNGKSALRPCFHMMFSGNPGTGKTVVARIIGKIFKEAGLLSVGNFFEVSRQDFIGKYVGHTAPKAMELCRSALGSVLFIDEAYSLANNTDTYSSEAISTLIAEMENHRDDMVVIFAGYAKELEDLLAMNPGLKDRIPHKIHFPNYTRDELKEIFYLQLRGKMEYDESFSKKADETFASLPDSLLQQRDFSNGRFVRNLVERIVSKAAMRFELSGCPIEEFRLNESDFSVAVSDNDFNKLMAKPQKATRIGF
ncbi:MAG: AAA family ATPase [Oscillospiraceae bacterium]|nr:AAA family ATPase [Oscillospiraceae bacterium]